MKTYLRAIRALARVELRDVRRHPGRSAIILALVAIPVAAVVGGSTLGLIVGQTAEEASVQAMGNANLRVTSIADFEHLQRILSALPSGAIVERLFVGVDEVSVPGRTLQGRLLALQNGSCEGSSLVDGMFRLQAGRAPRNSGEVALSPALLQELDRTIGQAVTLEYGPQRTITGIVMDPESLASPIILRTAAVVEHRGGCSLLVACRPERVPPTVRHLRQLGGEVTTREEAAEGDPFAAAMAFVLGGIGMVEAALVIASAFAVGIRRRQYELGLLAATGARAGSVTIAMLLSTALIALLGGMVGAVVGISAAACVHPFLDNMNHRLNGSFEVSAALVTLAIAMGIVAAVSAVAIPARNAARLPVNVALSGRCPPNAPAGGWLRWGLMLVAIGIALILFGITGESPQAAWPATFGPILGLMGIGTCSPWILDGLGRRAATLPLVWRLAVRDAGRFRGRNGPVVTAVLAGMAMSVTLAVFVASLQDTLDKIPSLFRGDQLLIRGPDAENVALRLRDELPCLAVTPLRAVYCHGMPVRARIESYETQPGRREWIACGGDELLVALDAQGARNAFRAGELLALRWSIEPESDPTTVQLTQWLGGAQLRQLKTTAVPISQPVIEPLFLIHEGRLESLDLQPGPPLNGTLVPWLIRLQVPVTEDLLDRAQSVAAGSHGVAVDAALRHRPQTRQAYWAVLAISVVTGAVVLIMATMLSAAESTSDQRILFSVGGSPGFIRSHLAARAAYLALLGCVLAIPAGILPAMGLFRMSQLPLEFVLPWRDLLLTVTVLPALVYVITWLSGTWQNPRWSVRPQPA